MDFGLAHSFNLFNYFDLPPFYKEKGEQQIIILPYLADFSDFRSSGLSRLSDYMKKYISRFHYITQDLPNRSHARQTQMACEAGVNWIQYRCLSKTDDEMLPEIHEIASICDDWGTTLILTNHYHLLDKADAQGVHIEDLNADLSAIRNIITDEKTLGASATSVEQILALQQQGFADYVGYGPFAHTNTKPNNYPLLGYNGYRDLEKHPINIPVIAIGGIQLNDVEQLMRTGIAGIAVSGAVNNAIDPQAMLKAFYRSPPAP